MSPSKFQEAGGDVSKASINGPRPSPLRINKESHAIHKPSSFVENPSHASSGQTKTQNPNAKRLPVIIYTHSPKIIHAQARDFMALVQKLTGYTRSEDEAEKTTKPEKPTEENKANGGLVKNVDNEDVDNDSSLTTAEEKYILGEAHLDSNSSAVSQLYGMQENLYMTAADIPLFTPNSHLFQSPSFGNALSSPSLMDYMKGFEEY